MAETYLSELVERRSVVPPTDVDERGWVAVSASVATYRRWRLVTDVDDVPLAVVPETYTIRTVNRMPSELAARRLERLAAERESQEAEEETHDE